MRRVSRKFRWAVVLLVLFAPLAVPGVVLADEITPCPASTFCIPNPLKFQSLADLLNAILNFLITIGAPIATIMIVYAGFTYIFAAGEPQKITQARAILLWTAVGYSIILVAKGILAVIKDVLGVA